MLHKLYSLMNSMLKEEYKKLVCNPRGLEVNLYYIMHNTYINNFKMRKSSMSSLSEVDSGIVPASVLDETAKRVNSSHSTTLKKENLTHI